MSRPVSSNRQDQAAVASSSGGIWGLVTAGALAATRLSAGVPLSEVPPSGAPPLGEPPSRVPVVSSGSAGDRVNSRRAAARSPEEATGSPGRPGSSLGAADGPVMQYM